MSLFDSPEEGPDEALPLMPSAFLLLAFQDSDDSDPWRPSWDLARGGPWPDCQGPQSRPGKDKK